VVTAVAADDLESIPVAAFPTALYDADRLAPEARGDAMPGRRPLLITGRFPGPEDSTISDSVEMLCPGGTYYLAGYGGTVTLPGMQLVLGEITVVGNLIGTRADLEDLVMLTAQGKVVLHSTRHPLEAANDAVVSPG
jgi:hypothetical protein